MSQTSPTANTDEALRNLEEEIGSCWQSALHTAFGSAAFALNSPAEPSDDCLWFPCDFIPAQVGCVAFGLDRVTAVALGHLLLSAKGRASEHDHHALHATTHLVRQLAALLARSLSARLNTAVDAADCSPVTQAPVFSHLFTVPFAPAEAGNHLLLVCPSPALLAAIANSSSSTSISSTCTAAVVPGSRATPRNLDLLLDLEMPVSVSFGATRLALKDVAKLTAGSIVELNRALSEPVDIVVNNCAIARGEVVVVDGNFAVRIKQVMSRQDRLRSLS